MLDEGSEGHSCRGHSLALRVARMLDKGSGTTELESKFLVKSQCLMFLLEQG